MMRKKPIHISILLSLLVLGALYSASTEVKQAAALPIQTYKAEYTFLNTTIWTEISAANQTSQSLQRNAVALFGTGFLTGPGIAKWNNTILQLEGQLQGINNYYKIVSYNMFTIDILLQKYDVTLQVAINASLTADSVQSQVEYCIQIGTYCGGGGGGYCQQTPLCVNLVEDTNHLSIQTLQLQNNILSLGSLFTKAKLEFLEHPLLNCTPRLAAAGKTISCHGSNYPPNSPTTAIFQDANGKNTTAQMTSGTDGSMTSNSFFDVFFDVQAPTTTGSYKLILEETGSPGINSFFDVFVEVTVSPTFLEPTTIIPLTVLIASIATLAVASRRVRRPI